MVPPRTKCKIKQVTFFQILSRIVMRLSIMVLAKHNNTENSFEPFFWVAFKFMLPGGSFKIVIVSFVRNAVAQRILRLR